MQRIVDSCAGHAFRVSWRPNIVEFLSIVKSGLLYGHPGDIVTLATRIQFVL